MGAVAWLVRAVCNVLCMFPRRCCIALMSRQSRRPFDFVLLEPYLRRAFPDYKIAWCCVRHGGRLGPLTMIRQLWLSSTSALCIVDGYVPAVCIPRADAQLRSRLGACMQLWHALGAFKCFGWQSLDTSEGRSTKEAETLAMHRGYDVVVAGLPGAVGAFAAAFAYPKAQVAAVGLPRVDYLTGSDYAQAREKFAQVVEDRLNLNDSDWARGPVVLYAPTFRRHPHNRNWHRRYVSALLKNLPASATLIVSGHPLDGIGAAKDEPYEGRARLLFLKSVPSIYALPLVDYVVTDYSAVAFEAMLAGRKVLFYVPDIDDYRCSPGLNIDPESRMPSLTFRNAEQLGDYIAHDVENGTYDQEALNRFTRAYGIDRARAQGGGSCGRIVALADELIERSWSADNAFAGEETADKEAMNGVAAVGMAVGGSFVAEKGTSRW